MVITVHCISLRVVRHNDTTSIVTVWSRERGRMVFAVPMGSGREAQRRKALMMPFSLFEGVARVSGNSEIARIGDVKPYGAANASGMDPVKNVLSMFLADFLYAVLRESEADENLTTYIFNGVKALRGASVAAAANFHLHFMYGLGRFVGIEPDMGTYDDGSFFDLREGRFSKMPPLHSAYLPPEKAHMVYVLSRLKPRNLHLLRLNRQQRGEILDTILDYYTMHHAPINNLTSLTILRTIFD